MQIHLEPAKRLLTSTVWTILAAVPAGAQCLPHQDVATLSSINGASGDATGRSADIRGNLAVLGAPFDDHPGDNSGSAYVYERDSYGRWIETTRLAPFTRQAGGLFGVSVALGDDRIAVGASGQDGGEGAAYVFRRLNGLWLQEARLKAPIPRPSESFGVRVDMHGDLVIVGAPSYDAAQPGAAYIYRPGAGGYELLATLRLPPGTGSNHLFGRTVALSDRYAVVGAIRYDSNAIDDGAAFVFERTGDIWSPAGTLSPALGTGGSQFGISVAVHGETVAVGAMYDDILGANSGRVYMFERRDGAWTMTQWLSAYAPTGNLDNDYYGASVALEGDHLIVGATRADGVRSETGAAYVYYRKAGTWRLVSRFTAWNAQTGASVGYDVNIDRHRIVVGAPNQNQGLAYVVTLNKLVADDDRNSNEWLGFDVATSADRVLVGAPYDSDPERGTSGAAYVYEWIDGHWTQSAKLTSPNGGFGFGSRVDIDRSRAIVAGAGERVSVFELQDEQWVETAVLVASDGASGDGFGRGAALDGDTIVVGAYADDDLGSTSGSAYVFVPENGRWVESAKLHDPDGEAYDRFGFDVDIDGDQLAVAITGDDDDSGAVMVFERTDGTWNPVTRIFGDGGEFARDIAISGDTIVIGAPSQGELGPDAGMVSIAEKVSGEWWIVQRLSSARVPGRDRFGSSVDIDGDTIVVGAETAFGYLAWSGRAHVFQRDFEWAPTGYYTASDAAAGAYFGMSAAIGDGLMVIGAGGVESSTGAAYVYDTFARPTLVRQPFSVTAMSGERAFFFVEAAADTALSYQWRKDGLELTGETAPFLQLEEIQPTDAGRYDAVVSTACGSIISDPATLAVEQIALTSGSMSGEPTDDAGLAAKTTFDGRLVIFQSDATNVVSDDTNGFRDIFLRDRIAGTVERISLTEDGTEGNWFSAYPQISEDGRIAAFMSRASNLVSGDDRDLWDIFVYDIEARQISRISDSPLGDVGNAHSVTPHLSGDGRYVAFASRASNLVQGDTNGTYDIFVKDRVTGSLERASNGLDGSEGNGDCKKPWLSGDGRYLSFQSLSSNLVPGDSNGTWDIFVRDLQTGRIERVSIASDGSEANDLSVQATISSDGRFVAFSSSATNLVSDDANGRRDCFLHDRVERTTIRISVSSTGEEGNSNSYWPTLSHDGRYACYRSLSSNLAEGDTNDATDIFVFDRITSTTRRVTVDGAGEEANARSFRPHISGNGLYIAFESDASNLVDDDSNGQRDIFLRRRPE